ncbi:TadE/TadG family type IV pilus assembly protein [Pseudidiomarina sp. E22-M8]|uniref:TadE/TadG family type IV pilus assembly protein n=1 Tax=Pseudidiomarina sp. E22-M8 TaxID=3424768 RepID=UPI00403C62FF
MRQRGQAVVETMLVLPVVLLTLLLVLQLLWLVFASATFRVAVSYSLRAGSINHGSLDAMERTLVAGMASLQPIIPATKTGGEPSRLEVQRAQLEATARQWLHYQLSGKIKVHQPTAEVLQTYAERRYDLASGIWVNELAVDHASVRMQGVGTERWQQQRQLEIEVWWCLPLEIPFAAQVLTELRQWWKSAAQAHCRLREEVVGRPLWALQQRISTPLQSGYREGLND